MPRKSLQTVSGSDLFRRNQKFFVALLAVLIASWVLILNVEIDSTIQTLILTLSPIIAAYWWPEASRTTDTAITTSRKTYWGFDPDVALALGVAFVIYVGLQVYLVSIGVASNWLKFVLALAPVLVGALTSPDTK